MKKLILILAFPLSYLTGYSQINLASSLTACYALNGNANEPVNNLNGVLSSVTPTVDRFNSPNSAYHFTGLPSSYIQLPNSPLLKASAVSLSGWLRFDVLNGIQFIVFAKNGCGSYHEGYQFAVWNPGAGYRFQIVKSNGACTPASQIILNSNFSPVAQTWYNFGFYAGPDSLKIFINGVLDVSVANANPLSYDPNLNVYLGGSNVGVNFPFKGSLDNIRFYNRKLSNAEFNQLYTQDHSCGPAIALPPVVSFSASSINVCQGNTVALTDLSSNTPTSWNWQIPGGSPSTSSLSSPIVSFPASGNYVVSLISSNAAGAGNTATQSIIVKPKPVLSIVPSTTVLCIGQGLTLLASGASGYVWSNNQTGASINITVGANNSFSVIGTGTNGCVSTASTLFQGAALPMVNAFASKTLVCQGDSVVLTAAGANNYTWSTQQTGASIQVNPMVNTIYNVLGKNASGCGASATVGIVVSPLPLITAAGSNSVVCKGEKVVLMASGGVNYIWNTSHTTASIQVSPATNTIYSVTGSNANGCSASSTVAIVVLPLPVITAVSNRSVICRGEGVTLIANGGLNYVWSNTLNTSTIQVAPTSSGSYSVTGTDTNGCKNTAVVNLIVNACTELEHLRNSASTFDFKVYPNPVNGILNVVLSEKIKGLLVIYNSLGQQLVVNKFNDEESFSFDFQNFENGLYFITIKAEEKILTTKIIKN